MRLPFTDDQFLGVFAAFNLAWWPVLAALWLLTLAVVVRIWRGRGSSVGVSALVALHWIWTGLVYHAAFFARINPAAPVFAVLFVLEGLAFLWLGVAGRRLHFGTGRSPRFVAGHALTAYALAYPALVVASGHRWPAAPLFGVPCPTLLLTAGLLLVTTPPAPRVLFVVPIVWSIVGGSAAVLFDMTPDFALLLALALMVGLGLVRRRPRPPRVTS